MTVIDAHTHFYDSFRPQGVPWPRATDDASLLRVALPDDYRALRVPRPVNGAIVVETSTWIEDNQWLLDLAANDPFIVAVVGNLPVGTPEFARHLDRFTASPAFRGVRLTHAKITTGLSQQAFVSDLSLLASRDLELDVYGGPSMLSDVVRLAKLVPDLRIVVNHMANVKSGGSLAPRAWSDGVKAAAAHPYVFCKVSALVEGAGRGNRTLPDEIDFYRPVLDTVWAAFGEDRLIYGSNWPVCNLFASLATLQGLVTKYFAEKGKDSLEKFLFRNAAAVYKWRYEEAPTHGASFSRS